jgi:hypothetical protein
MDGLHAPSFNVTHVYGSESLCARIQDEVAQVQPRERKATAPDRSFQSLSSLSRDWE